MSRYLISFPNKVIAKQKDMNLYKHVVRKFYSDRNNLKYLWKMIGDRLKRKTVVW